MSESAREARARIMRERGWKPDAARDAAANNAAAARKAVKDEAAARKADNAAAAQADAMKGRPPVIPLGQEGACNVYYSIPHRCVYKQKANEHTPAHLYRLAALKDYARWIAPELSDLPPDAQEKAMEEREGAIMKRARRLLLELTGGKQYNPELLRGRGVWRDADGIVYNAGDACFLVRVDGSMEQVDGVRGRYIYDAGAPLIHPAADALTDEEGARLVDFFTARPWVLPCAGELVAGAAACAFLAGVLPYRPQLWVNAPAGTGKSVLKRDMLRALGGRGDGEEVAGGHAVQLEGGDTTPNAVHQKIRHDALPVVFDEAESNGGERRARNMEGLLALVRSAATSGDVGLSKGGADGTAKNYLLRCCFLLFSIANNLDRDADTSRFLVLRLSPLMDDAARAAMWQRQEATRAMTQGQDFPPRLFTRLLRAVPALMDNAQAIRAHLMAAGHNARRAELLGYLLAGAHALAKRGAVTDEDKAHAAEVAQAVEEGQERTSDTRRCMDALMGYAVPWRGGRITVARLCKAVRDATADNMTEAAAARDALDALGLRWRADLDALQVDTTARGLRELYKGTDWEGGRVAHVLAEGCKRDKSPNALGVWLQSCKVSGRPVWLPMIPAALVLPADG